MFSRELGAKLEAERILAVITVDQVENAVPLARALVAGGVRVIELAWRTEETLAAIAAIKVSVPEIILGVGTLLSAEQVSQAKSAGADFGVSPSVNVTVLNAARNCQLPYAPGVQTPTDVHTAIEHGCRWLKFFPAETAGGLAHLRSVHAPFAHLGLRYIALGGITEANAHSYLSDPLITVVGGSWIASAALVRRQAWDEVRLRALAARTLVANNQKTVMA
jgi:2-dehydro-3-deoxyphosphogluconate aldolase / (4S)-4-hydroxy-2-oxoglutarate aldolase